MAKKVKNFKNENEEREYWAKVDSSEHFDFARSKKVAFPKLKPSTKAIFEANKIKHIRKK